MTIDTVILKASLDLYDYEDAIAGGILKMSQDVKKGKLLQSVKLHRYITPEGWDFIKSNLPR